MQALILQQPTIQQLMVGVVPYIQKRRLQMQPNLRPYLVLERNYSQQMEPFIISIVLHSQSEPYLL